MTELADRRRRRRRAAATAAIVVLLAVAASLTMLWRRSVQETRRAEAAKLLALAQARLADDPTEALALTTASLEVADTREAREFVMRVLWTAPPALELDSGADNIAAALSFSSDGRYVAAGGFNPEVRVWSGDGRGPIRLEGHAMGAPNTPIWTAKGLLVTGTDAEISGRPGLRNRVQLWSIPDGTLLRAVDVGSMAYWQIGRRRLFTQVGWGEGTKRPVELRSWQLPDGPEELLDSLPAVELAGISDLIAAPDGSGWVVARGREVLLRLVGGGGLETMLEKLDAEASLAPFGEAGILMLDEAGNMRMWSFDDGGPSRLWAIHRPAGSASAVPDPAGHRLASLGPTEQSAWVWERAGLPGARALELRRSGSWYNPTVTFHPSGHWCVATTHQHRRLTFWPLARPYPSVVDGYRFPRHRRAFAFSPDSRWLATGWEDRVRLVPVDGGESATVRELRLPEPRYVSDIRFDPGGRYLFVVNVSDAWIVPLDGGPCVPVVPDIEERQLEAGAISPSGARVATALLQGEGAGALYVFDVVARSLQSVALPQPDKRTGDTGVWCLGFLDEQTLLTAGWGGIRRWDLATGTHELLVASEGLTGLLVNPAAGTVVTWESGWGADVTRLRPLELLDLATRKGRPLEGFGHNIAAADLDPSGTVLATSSIDGTVRVGRLDGGEPHLLVGHTGHVRRVAISPDLRWVASAGEDSTLRLWPMPDLTKPPLHTLPHDELLAKLHSLTNLRAVRDSASDTGWTIELGPFPGWREVPTW